MINLRNCDSIDFIENVIKHSGADGISMVNDVINCKIIGNYITDITSSGITVAIRSMFTLETAGAVQNFLPE